MFTSCFRSDIGIGSKPSEIDNVNSMHLSVSLFRCESGNVPVATPQLSSRTSTLIGDHDSSNKASTFDQICIL